MLGFKKFLSEEEKVISRTLEKEIEKADEVLRPMLRHVVSAGGKRVRPLLTVLMGRVFGCRDEALYVLGAAVEMIHTATLLHDDVIDGAELRRGSPAAHKVFGVRQAIMAGDGLLSVAVQSVLPLADKNIIECLARAVGKTVAGEVDELENLHNPDLSYEDYLRIITGKTAFLISCAGEMGALYAGASPEGVRAAATFGLEMGIAFQLVDDALDLAPEEDTGKPTGGDLREGKFTPPLFFYLRGLKPEESRRLAERFRQGISDQREIEEIVSAMRALRLDEKTRELADGHLARAEEALALLPEGRERELLLKLTAYIRKRNR